MQVKEINVLIAALRDEEYHVFYMDDKGEYHVILRIVQHTLYFMDGFMLDLTTLHLSDFKKGVLISL